MHPLLFPFLLLIFPSPITSESKTEEYLIEALQGVIDAQRIIIQMLNTTEKGLQSVIATPSTPLFRQRDPVLKGNLPVLITRSRKVKLERVWSSAPFEIGD